MRGLALNTVMMLVIALIVIFLALYILSLIPSLSQDYVSGDISILSKYTTCSLAYCASGAGSDQVKKVGCLKQENGVCVLSCDEVEEKEFSLRPDNSFRLGLFSDGPAHYCGRDYAIPFEFSGVGLSGGTLLVRSGQLDKIAKSPSWVCKPAKLPFVDIEIDEIGRYIPVPAFAGLTTADAQYRGDFFYMFNFPKNCIMLSKSVTDSATYANTITFAVNFVPFAGQAVSTGKAGLRAVREVKVLNKFFGTSQKDLLLKASRSVINTIKSKKTALVTTGTAGSLAGGAATFLVGEADVNDPHRSRGMLTKGGCFTGYVYDYMEDDLPPREDVLYAPIVQFDSSYPEIKVYPSAIYVDESFTTSLDGSSPPECEYDNPELVELKEDVSKGLTTVNDLKEKFRNEFKEANKNNPDYKIESYKIPTAVPASGSNTNNCYGPDKVTVIPCPPVVGVQPSLTNEETETSKSEDSKITQEILDEMLEVDADDYADRKLGRGSISGIDVYGTGDLSHSAEFDFGNMVKGCKLKTTYEGKKIRYKVWSNPTYPGIGTLRSGGETWGNIGRGIGGDLDAVVTAFWDFLSSDDSSKVREAAQGTTEIEDNDINSFMERSNKIQFSIEGVKTTFKFIISGKKNLLDSSKSKEEKDEIYKIVKLQEGKLSEYRKNIDSAITEFSDYNNKGSDWESKVKKKINDKITEIEEWIKVDSNLMKNQNEIAKKLSELDVSANEEIPDINDNGRGWMSQFGSCAFVTLSRDIPGRDSATPIQNVPITSTPSLPGMVVLNIEDNNGSPTTKFKSGDVVVFSGQVKNIPEGSRNNEVFIDLVISLPTFIVLNPSQYDATASLDSEGNFKVEYQTDSNLDNKGAFKGTYTVTVRYTGMTPATATFEVM